MCFRNYHLEKIISDFKEYLIIVINNNSETVKFRAYSLISQICCISAAHQEMMEKEGFLDFIITFDRDDILSSLNSIELYIAVLSSLMLDEQKCKRVQIFKQSWSD